MVGLTEVAIKVTPKDSTNGWYYHESDGQLWVYATHAAPDPSKAEPEELETDVIDCNLDIEVVPVRETHIGK